jgi:hypothetical protein
VFEYLTDPRKATLWQTSLERAVFSPAGPMQLGTRITETRRLLGQELASTVEVTEFEPPRCLAGRVVAGPAKWEFRHTLSEVAGSTTLRFQLEGNPGRFFRLGEPLVVRAMKKQLAADFSKLRELAEASARDSP